METIDGFYAKKGGGESHLKFLKDNLVAVQKMNTGKPSLIFKRVFLFFPFFFFFLGIQMNQMARGLGWRLVALAEVTISVQWWDMVEVRISFEVAARKAS